MRNDRFKLRVWDNINKRYEKDLTLIDKDGDLCYQDGHKYCNGEHPEDFTIEQCTGLKDKNGELIYEGDVVIYNESEMEIIWHEAWGGFAKVSCTKKRLGLKLDYWELFDHESNQYEIIGNIHEMEVER